MKGGEATSREKATSRVAGGFAARFVASLLAASHLVLVIVLLLLLHNRLEPRLVVRVDLVDPLHALQVRGDEAVRLLLLEPPAVGDGKALGLGARELRADALVDAGLQVGAVVGVGGGGGGAL